jgi:iron(III) transport system permease protein
LRLRLIPTLFSLVLALPILGIFTALLNPQAGSTEVLSHLFHTVLPSYAFTTLMMAIGVAIGVASMGVICAWLVATCDFPGKRIYEWALILPLAMPTYVMAYAYTDFFQFSGPVPGSKISLGGDLCFKFGFVPLCLFALSDSFFRKKSSFD